MSIHLMARVFESDLGPTDKVIMLALADWADDEGGHIWAGLDAIAAKASIPRRTLIRHLQALSAKDGPLEVVARGGDRRGDTNQYRILVDRLVRSRFFSERKGQKRMGARMALVKGAKSAPMDGPGRVPNRTREGCQAVAPDPSLDPSKAKEEAEEAAAASLPDHSEEGGRGEEKGGVVDAVMARLRSMAWFSERWALLCDRDWWGLEVQRANGSGDFVWLAQEAASFVAASGWRPAGRSDAERGASLRRKLHSALDVAARKGPIAGPGTAARASPPSGRIERL